jgi:hypothetical protein
MNKFVLKNTQDLAEEGFERLEMQFSTTNHNMNLLMVALTSMPEPLRYDEGSKLDIRLEGKSREHEDSGKESQKIIQEREDEFGCR